MAAAARGHGGGGLGKLTRMQSLLTSLASSSRLLQPAAPVTLEQGLAALEGAAGGGLYQ